VSKTQNIFLDKFMSNKSPISLSLDITPLHPVDVWVLQLGGWFPIPFTTADVVLVDRNITITLDDLIKNPNRTDMIADKWWLDHLNSERFLINPILCAMEGENREMPSFTAFCDEIFEATEILSVGLPKARIVHHDTSLLSQSYENVTATATRQLNEVRFLLKIAPLIRSRVSAGKEKKIKDEIFNTACELNLRLNSLVVICVLSCLYEPQNGSEPMIGRRVLKPNQVYSEADAYNALSDIRSLEFLIGVCGLDGRNPGLCTRDKFLAAFWVNLMVSEPVWTENNIFLAKLSPKSQLFPRLKEEELVEMLSQLQ
jgi:hypothetical protein